MVEPGNTTTRNEKLTLHLKCFAPEEYTFKETDSITLLVASQPSGVWKKLETAHKLMSRDGKVVDFTLREWSGKETSLLVKIEKLEIPFGKDWTKDFVLTFRYCLRLVL